MQFVRGVAEALTPLLTSSHFASKGVLTPEEFVAAGDALVAKCATWSWDAGVPAQARPYLPPDKQYLVTHNVPSLRRVRALAAAMQEHVLTGDGMEDGWVDTFTTAEAGGEEAVADLALPSPVASPPFAESPPPAAGGEESDEDMDIPDMGEDVEDEEAEEADAAAAPAVPSPSAEEDGILRTRTYDVSITYDKYYQVPRIWLFGYDEARQPLREKQVWEDISADHAKKTVTMETHPHLPDVRHASIHPCRHAAVLKRLMEQMGVELRADQSLFLFLKFMSSVLPTIEYDYTVDFGS